MRQSSQNFVKICQPPISFVNVQINDKIICLMKISCFIGCYKIGESIFNQRFYSTCLVSRKINNKKRNESRIFDLWPEQTISALWSQLLISHWFNYSHWKLLRGQVQLSSLKKSVRLKSDIRINLPLGFSPPFLTSGTEKINTVGLITSGINRRKGGQDSEVLRNFSSLHLPFPFCFLLFSYLSPN